MLANRAEEGSLPNLGRMIESNFIQLPEERMKEEKAPLLLQHSKNG